MTHPLEDYTTWVCIMLILLTVFVPGESFVDDQSTAITVVGVLLLSFSATVAGRYV